MPTDLLQQNIAPLLGIDMLPEAEKEVFLMDIGALIMESALLKLVNDLTNEQVAALDHYLETEPSEEVFMEYVLSHHKNFSKILEAETLAFKAEALEIFQSK